MNTTPTRHDGPHVWVCDRCGTPHAVLHTPAACEKRQHANRTNPLTREVFTG